MGFILCAIIFRIALPLLMLSCVVFRPTALSAVYLILALCSVFCNVPTHQNMAGGTGLYLKILMAFSVLGFLLQSGFQAYLAIAGKAIFNDPDYTWLEDLLRYCGFVRLDNAQVPVLLTWITPEIVMVLTSVIVFLLSKRLTRHEIDPSEVGEAEMRSSKTKSGGSSGFMLSWGKYIILSSLCICACLRPSIQGSIYFTVFICAATWLSCSRTLERGFAIIVRVLMAFVFLHILILYVYQIPYITNLIGTNSTYARYFALTNFFSLEEEDPRAFEAKDLDWDNFVNPFCLILLFFFSILISNQLAKPKVRLRESPSNSTEESTPLMRGVSPSRRYGSDSKRGPSILQDSTGSVTVGTDQNADEISLHQLGVSDDEDKPGCFEGFILILEQLMQFVIQVSYVATNIIMMTWSITYHCWLTFVLLLWANFLWIVPNQRRSMLRSSPFLVCYAIFLLVSAYLYSMDFTEEELPSQYQNINLKQIGFEKITQLPCKPLFAKCAYTVMFWFTLRQYTKERREAKQKSALADMVAPLQVTVGTAAGSLPADTKEEKTSKTLAAIGTFLAKLLTRCWIWVVAITLFVVAITGERMTVFRILYMALFLFFILTFQLSFAAWRKMMFGFWLVVIIYSMLILILVYTYQFDNFPSYWTDYLHVPKEQQLDIGLETYATTQLFVRLATPTFFVIVTVIQLQYFHKDFLLLSAAPAAGQRASTAGPELSDTVSSQGPLKTASSVSSLTEKQDKTDDDSEKIDLTDIGRISGKHLRRTIREKFARYLNVVSLFLEIHMHRLVLLIAALMCIYDKCALYCTLVVLLVIGIVAGRKIAIGILYLTSIFTAILLLLRMVYQVDYVVHDKYNVSCSFENMNYTANNAEWLGFYKSKKLAKVVQWNIAYLTAATLYSVILIRQYSYRLSRGIPMPSMLIMFPDIGRVDADKNLRNGLKYLFNYCYYKFGIEITLMALVGLIGFRMDLCAICYAIWLCILCVMNREVMKRGWWNVLLVFTTFSIPIQYFMSVGLSPGLCIPYPWDMTNVLQRVQDWAFLMDNINSPNVKKLICDFVLLFFVSRQRVVFKIESQHGGADYPGGTNESVVHHAEEKDFVNPVPDFITYTRSYLDILKSSTLIGFMWITLATLFLAGTNRINIFCIGYLVGAFIFLWQGTDIYLKPLPRTLTQWNMLIGYNVFVILLKALFQLVGCVFVSHIPPDFCWVIQLLGIGCVDKFEHSGPLPTVHLNDICNVPRESIGIAWDGVCFGFLLMQKRIFCSYNFFHIIDETKATAILASRGAELIEQLRQKRMQEKGDHEKQVLEKIKAKMDRIKATQQKIQGPKYEDETSHHIDRLFPKSRPRYRTWQPMTYKQAIRSGDYYMFDDVQDDEDYDLIEEIRQIDDEDEDDDKEKKPTIGKLLSHAMKTDISSVIRKSDNDISRRRILEESPRRVSSPYMEKEPRPSTSKDDDFSEPTEPTSRQHKCQKFVDYLLFAWKFFESLMVSLIRYLNRQSRDFRYIVKVLKKEKKLLKESTAYTEGIRVGRGQRWVPSSSYHTLIQTRLTISTRSQNNVDEKQALVDQKSLEASSLPCSPEKERRKASVLTVPEIRILAPSMERGLDTATLYSGSSAHDLEEEETGEMSQYDQPTIARLVVALWYLVMCHSDILCYVIIFLNQIKSATFLSLPLPLMVFLWGTLTIPRPSKTFWVTIIAYTQIIVLIKCLFQFEFWTWNQVAPAYPFYPPKIIGVEKKSAYAVWDLLLLLVLFFHRYLLKSLGLWKSTVLPPLVITDGEYVVEEANPAYSPVDPNNPDEPPGLRVTLQTDEVEGYDMFPSSIRMATEKYGQPIREFFVQLRDPTSRVAADVYSYMFMCDFFNFFVILIGYNSFGAQQGDGGVSAYLQDNRVPHLFLLMLILQFLLIIVDRAIFLRKNIVAKIVFQFIQVVMLHVWLFVLFPIMTEREFNSVIPPQMYYMVKCFYLLLAAYQIRCGYPLRVLGNFLCKGYNYLNMWLFKGFMLVPFLFELRTVMDWMWTDTSMTVFDWIKMEDIFAQIFQLKDFESPPFLQTAHNNNYDDELRQCTRHVEDEYPQPRGQRKKPSIKYIMGGFLLFLIIAIIWFPLVFFSLGNAVGQPNVPFDVTLDVRIGPYEPVYRLSAQANSIFSFNEQDFKFMEAAYAKNKVASTFFYYYEGEDIAAIKLGRESASIWSISPPDRERMIEEVNSTKPLTIRLEYTISRKSTSKEDSGVIRDSVLVTMDAEIDHQPNPNRLKLLDMLMGESTDPVTLGYILPKFLKVTSRGTATPIKQLMEAEDESPVTSYLRQLNLTLSRAQMSNQEWWTIQENCSDVNYKSYLRKLPYVDCSSIIIYTFNDRIFPATLSIITAGGIIGVYTTLVFVASRVLRGFFSEICFKIMFDDMPNVDRVFQLCLDVYLVREAREFFLEEDLFAKLVFLFRSPETLIKWTRPKEEVEDEDDPEGDD